MNPNIRNFALWVVIIVLLVLLFQLFSNPGPRTAGQDIVYSQFLNDVDDNRISTVTMTQQATGGYAITGTTTQNTTFQTFAPEDATLIPRLEEAGVTFTVEPASDGSSSIFSYLLNWLPFILIIAIWIFFMRQMQGAGGRAMGFGKSKAKLLTESQGRVTFEDVAGVDEAKEDLQEIVEFLRDPHARPAVGEPLVDAAHQVSR